MITIKLANYRPEDAKLLHIALLSAYKDKIRCNVSNGSPACDNCVKRYLCEDLGKTIDYLQYEINHNFPHCKKPPKPTK